MSVAPSCLTQGIFLFGATIKKTGYRKSDRWKAGLTSILNQAEETHEVFL